MEKFNPIGFVKDNWYLHPVHAEQIIDSCNVILKNRDLIRRTAERAEGGIDVSKTRFGKYVRSGFCYFHFCRHENGCYLAWIFSQLGLDNNYPLGDNGEHDGKNVLWIEDAFLKRIELVKKIRKFATNHLSSYKLSQEQTKSL